MNFLRDEIPKELLNDLKNLKEKGIYATNPVFTSFYVSDLLNEDGAWKLEKVIITCRKYSSFWRLEWLGIYKNEKGEKILQTIHVDNLLDKLTRREKEIEEKLNLIRKRIKTLKKYIYD